MALANSMSQGRASPSGNATPEIKLEFCKPAGSQAGSQGLKKLESLCDRANGGAPETAAGAQLALEDARPVGWRRPAACRDEDCRDEACRDEDSSWWANVLSQRACSKGDGCAPKLAGRPSRGTCHHRVH